MELLLYGLDGTLPGSEQPFKDGYPKAIDQRKSISQRVVLALVALATDCTYRDGHLVAEPSSCYQTCFQRWRLVPVVGNEVSLFGFQFFVLCRPQAKLVVIFLLRLITRSTFSRKIFAKKKKKDYS